MIYRFSVDSTFFGFISCIFFSEISKNKKLKKNLCCVEIMGNKNYIFCIDFFLLCQLFLPSLVPSF